MVTIEAVGAGTIVLVALVFLALSVYFLKILFCCFMFPPLRQKGPYKTLVAFLSLYLLFILVLSIFSNIPYADKTAGPLHQLLGSDSAYPPFSPDLHLEFPEITIITFSSDGYVDALENAIGSLHVWARGVPIVVYDIGLSTASISRIQSLENVRLQPFNFSQYPAHVVYMHNYAFKPILMADAVEKFGTILSLDAGIELRQSPRHIFQAIRTVGYFFVETSDSDPLSRVNPKTVEYLELPAPDRLERQCYAGMQGYRRDSVAVGKVLQPAALCALDSACIDPPGSGHENHRYEQAVLSLFLRKHRLHCSVGRLFSEHLPATLNPDPLAMHQPQLFFFRRWRYPKPYAAHALRTSILSNGGAATPAVGVSAPVDPEGDEEAAALYENGVTDRKTSDLAFVRCLQETGYDADKCREAVEAFQQKASSRAHLGSAAYRCAQERYGWVLTQASRVYWLWPLTLREAVALVGLGATGVACWALRPQSRAGLLVTLATCAVFIALRTHRPEVCAPGVPIGFLSMASSDPFLLSGLGRVQCGHLSIPATQHYVRSSGQQFAFFAMDAYAHSIVSFAVAPLTSVRSPAWTHGGVALVSPVPLTRPCVFMHNGSHYMLPHQPGNRHVSLYMAAHFPLGWHVVRDLLALSQPPAAMLYLVGGHWFLRVSEDNGFTTQIFRSSQLLGPYTRAARAELPSSAAVCSPGPDS